MTRALAGLLRALIALIGVIAALVMAAIVMGMLQMMGAQVVEQFTGQ